MLVGSASVRRQRSQMACPSAQDLHRPRQWRPRLSEQCYETGIGPLLYANTMLPARHPRLAYLAV